MASIQQYNPPALPLAVWLWLGNCFTNQLLLWHDRPFYCCGIFAALLNYPVGWLSRSMPRGLAIAITFIGAVALLLGLIMLVGLEVVNQGQGLLTQLRNTLNQPNFLPFRDFLNQLDISRFIGTLQTGLASGLGVVQTIFSSVFTGIFGAVISLYMLIHGEKLWQLFLRLVPVASRDRFAQTFDTVSSAFCVGNCC
jgi:predicted PurR-regulated permease PerM